MKMKQIVAGALALASSNALADMTGNLGAVSEYLFRGISQGTGGAIQGGIDYAAESGLYVGAWGSNVDWAFDSAAGDTVGGVEVDGYVGFAGTFTDMVSYDVGAIYYFYPEQDEDNGDSDVNTIEVYGGLSFGAAGLKVFYSPKFFGAEDPDDGDDVAAMYVLGTLGQAITETLKFTAAIGFSMADESIFIPVDADADLQDSYVDYSIGLAKSIDETLTGTFQIVGTGLDGDDPQILLGLKKTFGLL